ncbi:YbjN domain-containing protein [Anaerotruncus colihominis]|uniref:YbjN domain-containing protein n=1 Tax=Anaerotruncus colihominis DSM 17241 TaxID=445972 RepID=B0P8Q6_9FIRM|nr:YbjN domain-containing protein [Anaerotruncus colihominis]EDS12302.1 hypothetical protein ANACOL_01145 [Anaerotruncus colihominis DSM 17241]UWN74411.1 YbjN domain-containing protein [Anaerotruncus colihominis]
MDTLASLLEQAGYDFLVRGEEAHLVFTDGRVRWHAVCVEQKEAVLIYSRYPFRMEDETQALYACNRINAVDLWGHFYLEDGAVVVRTRVDLTDAFYAPELFLRGIGAHCASVSGHWRELFARAGGNPPRLKSVGL